MLGIVLRDYLHLGETEFCEHLQMISNSIQKCLEDEPEIHLNRKLYGDEVVQDMDYWFYPIEYGRHDEDCFKKGLRGVRSLMLNGIV